MVEQKVIRFLFEGDIPIRVVERDGSPWFVASDVCRALGLANASQAIQQLDDDEKGICSTYTPGGAQEMLIVSESGLFTMLTRGREAVKPGTLPHRFRRWVMGEVLPAIRRTGSYGAPVAAPSRTHILPEMDRVQMVREIRHTFGKREAQQAWFGLHLPIFPAMLGSVRQGDLF